MLIYCTIAPDNMSYHCRRLVGIVHANASCCNGGSNIDNDKVFFSECDRHIAIVLVYLKRVPTEKISCAKMGVRFK